MSKKLVLMLSGILFSQYCIAETCPSIADIKTQLGKGWTVYDSFDNKPMSIKQVQSFANSAQEFALAEWVDLKQKGGAIHCYYRDRNGSNLEAYIVKNNFNADKPKKFWYVVTGAVHCAAGNDKCQFQSHTVTAPQLAKK